MSPPRLPRSSRQPGPDQHVASERALASRSRKSRRSYGIRVLPSKCSTSASAPPRTTSRPFSTSEAWTPVRRSRPGLPAGAEPDYAPVSALGVLENASATPGSSCSVPATVFETSGPEGLKPSGPPAEPSTARPPRVDSSARLIQNRGWRRSAPNLDGPAPVGTHAEAKGDTLSVQCHLFCRVFVAGGRAPVDRGVCK